MPPKGRSSSSHSSRSSSSRSSSSRSSSRSSRARSSSSRSSSSRSSSYRSSSSRPSSYRSSGPSRHSATSRSSRPRINQPTGYNRTARGTPSYYYGGSHDYVFFPIGWVDESTGRSYEKGYYDENGQHYDNVAFEKNGRYENVLCHCPYCDQDTIMNPTAEDISTQRLQCPNCGGALEIRSALDTYQNIPQRYAQGYAQGFGQPVRKKSILPRILLILAALMAALYAYGSYLLKKEAVQPEQHAEFQITEPDPGFAEDEYPFGDRIDLASDGNNVYTVSDGTSDKQLVWDVDADSYYDEDSDCWVWYNTDVEPPIWQYWYEGISSDFGDYGWMEHDEDGWFIEESYGNWIELPSEYDTEALWYIEE